MRVKEFGNNRRIAKNAVMLYIRMFLAMVVGLYTSRVVLNVLGVEDYGIYGVVGGVIAMLGFLNASMSGATSRFLTYELGKGDKKRLAETFSSALIVHMGIALIVLLFAETVGLWFVMHKLVIPAERMGAAHWVYQLSILSSMLAITQVPYNALIIAHEEMDIYAWVEILHVVLKLLIVYVLVIGHMDKLKLYAVLVLAVGAFIMMVYRLYCLRHFKESRFHWIWDKSILKPMLNFSWQTIIAHMSFSFRQQGTNFALNMVFGVIVNAASGIASTVNGIISQFSANIIAAFNPQIIKQYAQGDFKSSCRLIISASKYSTLLILLIIIPFEFEAEQILRLWLGQVPQYAVHFNRLMMLSLLTCVTNPVYIGLTANGNIKSYSLLQASLYVVCPFIIYLLCYAYRMPELAYVVIIAVQFIAGILVVIIFKYRVPEFSVTRYLRMALFAVALPSCVSVAACFAVYRAMSPDWMRLLLLVLINAVILCGLTFAGLTRVERTRLKSLIMSKLSLRGHESN